jgi:hypothetical protein
MTTVTYRGQGIVQIRSTQGTDVEMPVHKFCEIDGDLHDVAARAMECPGEAIVVPSVQRGRKPRHSQVHSICQ